MLASQLPPGFLDRFSGKGSTMQVANFGSLFVAEEDKFIYEGELERLWMDGNDICARLLWLAEKDVHDRNWYFVTDPTKLDFRMSLELFRQGGAPDDGRFMFQPAEPLSNESLLLVAHDYLGPTGRVPLARSEVKDRPVETESSVVDAQS